ncbi:MAG: Na+/H+ antiporter subunit G [Gammaproteobacteria bacterium HGW-Gammaproteobacteria-14]|nr:MAG: Na+/H+ antiporter subunit G [Gammaproteobacteria bacterium HGW-Gammaproteobacteria-14]
MAVWIEGLVAVLVLLGAAFTLIASIGLVRMRDFYTRLHGPTKASTLGVGSIMLASLLFFSVDSGSLSVHEVLITVFLFLTAPVSAHLLAKAGMHGGEKLASGTRGKPWDQ